MGNLSENLIKLQTAKESIKTAIESKDNVIAQLNQQIATMQQKPMETAKEQSIVAAKPKETINF